MWGSDDRVSEVDSPNDSFDEVKAITRDLEGPVERGTDLPSRAPSQGRMILLRAHTPAVRFYIEAKTSSWDLS